MLGNRKAILETDQEPAIVAPQRYVVARMLGLAAENTAVAHSATNRVMENAARFVTGMTRTLKGALECRLGRSVPPESAPMAWAVCHAAAFLNLYSIDDGGRSSMQRARGQGRLRELAESGDNVLFQPMAKCAEEGELGARWHYGVFLGIHLRTNEIIERLTMERSSGRG